MSSTGLLLSRRWRRQRRIREGEGRRQPLRDGAQHVEGQHRHRGELKALRGGVGHPPRDLEINAVRSADRDRQLGVAGRRHHQEFLAGKRMEAVVDRDLRRQGIVTCCC